MTGCTRGFAAPVDQGLLIHSIKAQGIATIVPPAPSTASLNAAFDQGAKTAGTVAAQSKEQAAHVTPGCARSQSRRRTGLPQAWHPWRSGDAPDAILIVHIAIQMPPSREPRYERGMPSEPDTRPVDAPGRAEELTVAIVLLLAGVVGVATTVARGATSGGAGGLGVAFFIAGGFALRVALRRRGRARIHEPDAGADRDRVPTQRG